MVDEAACGTLCDLSQSKHSMRTGPVFLLVKSLTKLARGAVIEPRLRGVVAAAGSEPLFLLNSPAKRPGLEFVSLGFPV